MPWRPWLIVFTLVAVGAAATRMVCPGCLDRSRFNKACQWMGDTPFPLDAQNPRHQTHLVADAQLAEELAIRYADLEFKRRFRVAEHHGGLLDEGRFRSECLTRMFKAIEEGHNVTPAQVQAARGGRHWVYDAAVVLLFLPFYSLGAVMVCRRLSDRFAADGLPVLLTALGAVSLAYAMLGLYAIRLYGAFWEVARVGNGHMTTIRAASYTRWNHQHDFWVQVMVAVILFWLTAAWSYRSLLDQRREIETGT
jgi:hypothetical protein